MFQKIPKLVVYVALFLVPLFSLPFTSNVLDFQKQFLLLGLVSVGMFFWIWDVLSEKKLAINLNPMNLFAGGLVAVTLVSGIFSLYSYGSLWGMPLPVAESFATVLSLAMLYFLIANNFKKGEIYSLIATIVVSGAVAALYAIIQALGWYLPFSPDYAKNPSFNTIGATSSFSLFIAILLAAVFPLVFFKNKFYRRLMIACGGVMFLALVFFNGVITLVLPSKAGVAAYDLSLAPWIVLGVSALATFLFSVSDQKFVSKNSRAKNTSFALLFLALLFLTFNIFAKDMSFDAYNSAFKAIGAQFSIERSLDQGTAFTIAVNTLKQSAQTFFLGSGPGTFVYDFVKFKPWQMNQDNFSWNVTFFNGTSEVINRIATTGLLGIIMLMAVIILWTIKGFRTLTDNDDNAELPLAIFGGWLAIVVALFYAPFNNLCLALLFWLFLGLIIAMDEERSVVLTLKSVKLTYAVSLTFVAILALELGLLVWSAKRYYAEIEYRSAIISLQKNDLAGAISKLTAAASSTNQLQDNYLTSLSQIYFAQAQQELTKKDANPQDALKAAAPYLKFAVDAATLGTDAANPNNSANWATRGYIYRQLIGVSDGFDTWALNTYQKALALEPNNPELLTELGQVYVVKKDLAKAKESFNKAIALRPQYVYPHYYLALIADQEGDKQVAIEQLQTIQQYLPEDDATSRDNVAKAIESLKAGKSLIGQQAPAESQPVSPESGTPATGAGSVTNPITTDGNVTPQITTTPQNPTVESTVGQPKTPEVPAKK